MRTLTIGPVFRKTNPRNHFAIHLTVFQPDRVSATELETKIGEVPYTEVTEQH